MPKDLVITTYEFSELDEDTQDKVLEKFGDINVDDGWWYEFIYEDAERIGLKITSFDLDRRYCKGDFILSVEEVIEAILKEHGESTETYKDAMKYKPQLIDVQAQLDALEGNDDIEFGDYLSQSRDLELKQQDLKHDFLYDLLEDYRSMLQSEWDYGTSREAIVETLEANEFKFTKEGKVV